MGSGDDAITERGGSSKDAVVCEIVGVFSRESVAVAQEAMAQCAREFLGIDAERAFDTGSVAVLHIGAAGNSFACGPCEVANPFVALPVSLNASGAGSLQLPISCSAFSLFGASSELQFVLGFTTQTPCVFAPTVSFANRVQATFGL